MPGGLSVSAASVRYFRQAKKAKGPSHEERLEGILVTVVRVLPRVDGVQSPGLSQLMADGPRRSSGSETFRERGGKNFRRPLAKETSANDSPNLGYLLP